MATLNANSSVNWNVWAHETMSITTSVGQYVRWVFNPISTGEFKSGKQVSRSYGPAAINLTIGPFDGPGVLTLYNDSTTSITYTFADAVSMPGLITQSASTLNGGAFTFTPSNANATFSPTGTGTVTIFPSTVGSINNMSVGQTTMGYGRFNQFSLMTTDNSGTPGNTTINGPRGRLAIAAGQSSVVLTNSQLNTGNAQLLCQINQAAADATLTHIVRVAVSAGSATIYGNAAATAAVVVDFLCIAAG